LTDIRNTKLGLRARTRLLNILENTAGNARSLAEKAGLHYTVAMHHLKLLENEGIVQRGKRKAYVWSLTGMGQKRLIGSG
jgi:predicted ArsR family transcriptional regulator